MPILTDIRDHEIRISVTGNFDFKSHALFRKAYEEHPKTSQFVIDLSGVLGIDSSALGMMLLLREYAGNDNSHVAIVGCNTEVRKILEVARFHELFQM